MRYKDFKQLPKIKDKSKLSRQSQTKKESGKPYIEEKKSEQEIFWQAMEGVEPLSDQKKSPNIVKNKTKANQPTQNGFNKAKKYFQDFMEGKIEFEIQYSDEYLQGNVMGLDQRIFRKLKSGSYSPEGHLDLHGLNAEDAFSTLIMFIKKNYLAGKRCLLIIPGRGKNSPLGKSIIRENVQTWLTREPLKRVILAFSTAQPRHGGTGALYVLLRKYKKSRGKIHWERYHFGSGE